MKNSLLTILIATTLLSCKSKKVIEPITLSIKSTESYCGGAAPSQELLDDLKVPKDFQGRLYLHKERNRTDNAELLVFKNGSLELFGLSSGTFYLFRYPIMENSTSEEPNMTRDMEREKCLKKISLQPIDSFTVEKNLSVISKSIHLDCNPCLEPAP